MNPRLIVLVLFLVAVTTLWFFTPLKKLFQPETLWEYSVDLAQSPWTPALLLALFFIGTCVFIPVVAVALASAMIYSFWMGLLLSLLGVFLASLSGYFLGRYFGMGFLPEKVANRVNNFSEHFQNATGWTVLALRVAPTPPFTLTSMLSGVFKIPILPYCLGTVVGMIPMMTLIQLFGTQIIDLVRNPSFLALFSVIAVVILIFVYNQIKNHWTKNRSLS